jgi:hypothetical protein
MLTVPYKCNFTSPGLKLVVVVFSFIPLETVYLIYTKERQPLSSIRHSPFPSSRHQQKTPSKPNHCVDVGPQKDIVQWVVAVTTTALAVTYACMQSWACSTGSADIKAYGSWVSDHIVSLAILPGLICYIGDAYHERSKAFLSPDPDHLIAIYVAVVSQSLLGWLLFRSLGGVGEEGELARSERDFRCRREERDVNVLVEEVLWVEEAEEGSSVWVF